MKEKIKYDLGDIVPVYSNIHRGSLQGKISMITVTKKGIRYRITDIYSHQYNVWQDELLNEIGSKL